jgi:glycerol-3-phosphate dehydrogenase (NAD(P)+)
MKYICVLGEGAWGTAIATVLANNGHQVHLWCHDASIADSIKKHRTTRFAPDIILHESIIPYTDIAAALQKAAIIFEAVPVLHLRLVLEQVKQYYSNQPWIVLSKGIEQQTLLLPSQIIEDIFANNQKTVVVSGPSFAHDLIRKQPTAMIVAAHDHQHARLIQDLMNNDYLRLFYSPDMTGVQLGGALKNIISLGMGILDGAGYADNTKAWFLTQGLQEITHLAHALGADRETMYGLSGLGDLVLTAMGNHSKNYSIGRRIGAGESLTSMMSHIHTMPEGINTIQSAIQVMKKNNLDLLLMKGIYQVIFEQKNIGNVIRQMFK